MNFYAISALINLFTSLVLGGFVLIGNKKSNINIAFLFFAISIAVWSFGYYFWQISTDATSALFWSRVFMAGAIFIPPSYLYFVYVFLDLIGKRINFLRITFFIFSVFFLFNFTPLFISGTKPILGFNFWPQPGIVFHVFLLIWMFYVVYTTFLLFNGYLKTKGVKHQQIGIVLIGMAIGFIGGSTNYFLWYNLPVMPFGNILVSFYVATVAYAVIRFKFLNVKVITAQIFALFLVLVSLAEVFYSSSTMELIIRLAVFLVTVVFALLLIQSVLREVRRREETEKLSKELKKASAELKKANKKLKRLDQAKSEFLSIASHQLRTPLTVIKGYVSMMLEGNFGKVPKILRLNLDKVFISTERLISLVESLLNISRIESGRMEFDMRSVDLTESVSLLVEGFEKLAKEKKLKLEFLPDKNIPKVMADPQKVKEIISNIIDNSIKYTQKGSIIISLHQESQSIIFSCQDTGIGILSEDLPRLFEKFVRGKGMMQVYTEGTGLGMYFARMVVENMGGRIWAESPGKNKGSKFSFSLSLADIKKAKKING